MLKRHLTTRSESALEIRSSERPGDGMKPWATTWELMHGRLEVGTIESEEVVEKGEPKADTVRCPVHVHEFSGHVDGPGL
jgi:hypothetical protein